MYNFEVGGLIFYHKTKCYFYPVSGKLNPGVFRKTHPRSILAFIKSIERKARKYGDTMSLL